MAGKFVISDRTQDRSVSHEFHPEDGALGRKADAGGRIGALIDPGAVGHFPYPVFVNTFLGLEKLGRREVRADRGAKINRGVEAHDQKFVGSQLAHQYAGGAQLYGPSLEPEAPSRDDRLYSAEAIWGSAQSACRKAAR